MINSPAGARCKGLVGVDFLGSPTSGRWTALSTVLEVNPRYTASVELHERATGRLLLQQHARCWAEVSIGQLAACRPVNCGIARMRRPVRPMAAPAASTAS